MRVFSIVCFLSFCALAQNSAPLKRYKVDNNGAIQVAVSGVQQWTDTGVDVLTGARLSLSASGSMQYPQATQPATPDGLSRGWKDLLRVLPLNDAGRGALIGRIGSDELAAPFVVGSNREIKAKRPGRLFLGVNQTSGDQADGSYQVSIAVLEAGSANAPAFSTLAADTTRTAVLPGVNADLLRRIPRRIGDSQGNPGDMVNFLIVGTEQQVKQAFQTAGWVSVDKSKRDAVLHGLMSTLSKQAYVELPMSELYLFGRAQDYGFAHAEPFAVVASRHHLRIWRAPFDVNGQPLWVGAATHDIGFDKDQRNNGVTHKIDPNIDDERKYVGQTLGDTGLLGQLGYITPPNPLTEARTATGGSFHSDGKILVMAMNSAAVQ